MSKRKKSAFTPGVKAMPKGAKHTLTRSVKQGMTASNGPTHGRGTMAGDRAMMRNRGTAKATDAHHKRQARKCGITGI